MTDQADPFDFLGEPTAPRPASPREYDGRVTFRGHSERAERKHRQIIARIEECETTDEVDDILFEETPVLVAMEDAFPHYAGAVTEAAQDHKAILGG